MNSSSSKSRNSAISSCLLAKLILLLSDAFATKNEKFLVVQGKARFGFRHVVTGEVYELVTDGEKPEVVETVPGWSHDITNVGDNEMIVMLWANEVFDRGHPDTVMYKV